jgi:predicted negative regulator of RcsB-dependent stress response
LPVQQTPPIVQRQDSVQNQYLFALINNTELHWRAVSDYFPTSANELNRVYGAKANLQLAKWYRDHSLESKAIAILKRLKGQQVPVFCHIMASIELASIYRQQGDEKNSDFELSEALQLSSQLDDSQKNEINRRLPENLSGLWQTT